MWVILELSYYVSYMELSLALSPPFLNTLPPSNSPLLDSVLNAKRTQEVKSPWLSLLILDSIPTSSCKQIFLEKETYPQKKNANSGFCQLKCIYHLAFYNTEHKSE